MRSRTQFDPLEVGAIDNFYFDYSADLGEAVILSGTWTCAMLPYQGPLIDPTPQARVLSVTVDTAIERNSSIDGTLSEISGAFVIAQIGTYPASFAGGTYLHEASAVLDDGRILKRSATMLCAPSP